jgi:8-oxo-dGTP pyrophosphatase MutT (NUDIX family)
LRVSPQTTAIVRHAARVVLIDPQDRLLLFQCRSGIYGGEPFWITPGGGLLEGETHEQAALRELYEEVGLAGVDLQGAIWKRVHVFPWDDRVVEQHEHFFLCRAPHALITRQYNEPEEINDLLDHRWWTIDAIVSSREQFAPGRLGHFAGRLFSEGLPVEILDVGM